jgi:CubicO group peptidase (beta-lactamase class C family)
VVVPVPVDRAVTDFIRSRSPDDRSLPIAELQQLLERHNSRIGLGGLRAVVITADGRRWSGGTAEMDDDYERSAIGSLTKTFTTSIIMQEVARGTIKMDDPIGDLGIGFGKPQLTVRQLLTHTSGIAKVTENKALLEDGTPVEEVVLWAGRKPLDFSPGSRVKYSTTGFAVLGIHLENVTGRTFEDLVEERIAQPYGYDLEYFRSRYRSIGFATGGILINMDDLADWIRRYVRDRSTPGGLWAWDFRGTTGIGIHSYCPCEGRKSTALGHMGGRTFATVDADGTVVVIDSRGILVLENYESTQSLAQELRLLAGGGVKRLVP